MMLSIVRMLVVVTVEYHGERHEGSEASTATRAGPE
jgi:hypothetical protein